MSQIDDFLDGKPATPAAPKVSAIDAFLGEDKPKQNKGLASDVLTAVKQGALQLPGVATGILDIAPGALGFDRPASKAADFLGSMTGFQPSKWAKEANAEYSPETQQAKSAVDQAWDDPNKGAADVAAAYLQNPRTIGLAAAQSVPSMLAGGLVGRGLGMAAGIKSAAARAAIGEGSVMAGSTMDQIDASVDPQKAAAASLVVGAGGAAIGAGGAKIASRFGNVDIDSAIAGGVTAPTGKTMSLAKRVPAGILQEGLLEEAPQTALETGAQNWAEGKPLTEGMARNVTESALAGGLMGGGAAALTRQQQANGLPDPDAGEPPAQPPAPAANPVIDQLTQATAHLGVTPNPVAPSNPKLPKLAGWTDANLKMTLDLQIQKGEKANKPLVQGIANELARRSVFPYQPDAPIPLSGQVPVGAAPEAAPTVAPAIAPVDLPDAGAADPLPAVPPKPSEAMGIDPNAGVISKVAAEAVDGPASMEMAVQQAEAAIATEDNPEAGAPAPTPDQFAADQGAANVSNTDAAGALAAGVGGAVGADAAGGGSDAGLLAPAAGSSAAGDTGAPGPAVQEGDTAPVPGRDSDKALTKGPTNTKAKVKGLKDVIARNKAAKANVQDQPQATTPAAAPAPTPEVQAPQTVGGDGAAQPGAAPAGRAGVEADGVVPPSITATGIQASWVIRNKDTGEVVMETFDRAKVQALNTAKYEAVPVKEYLASLNKKTPSPTTTEPTNGTQAAQAQQTEAQGREEAALLSDSVSTDNADLRDQLRKVEEQILQAVPGYMAQGGGDIEAAMKSRKVPANLKMKRNAIKKKLQEQRAEATSAPAVAPTVAKKLFTDPRTGMPVVVSNKATADAFARSKQLAGKATVRKATPEELADERNAFAGYGPGEARRIGYVLEMADAPAAPAVAAPAPSQQAQAPAAAPAEPEAPAKPSAWSEAENGFTKRPVHRYSPDPRIHWATVQNPGNGVYVIEYRIGDKVVSTEELGDSLTAVKFHVVAKVKELDAKQASHQDPGEKPEAATKGVVNDSLKTAAKNEDTKPSEMRKWLLAEIDKELLQAPDRADYDEAVKRMGEKDAISMYTGNGLLGQNTETGFITFDVPGDGKFKVRNSVRGLLEFRKTVNSSLGFKDSGQKTLKPEQNDGVQGGSGGQMAAVTNMIEEGDFEAARDYAEAVGIKLEDVKVPRGDMKPAWEKYLKDGTVPPPPNTAPLPEKKTAAQENAEKLEAEEAERRRPKDTGWNMAGTGYGGKRYTGRNITLDDGRQVVARIYENAGRYNEVEIKVDGARKFTVTDEYSAQDKADAFIRTLTSTGGDAAAPAAEPKARPAARVTPQISGDPEKFIKVAADSVRELRSVDVDRVLTETPVQFRAEVAGYIKDRRQDLADEVDDVMADLQPRADTPTAKPAPAIPEGYKPAGEPFYRDGNLVQGYAPFDIGQRVTMKESGGQSGVIDLFTSPDDGGVFSGAMVKFDNGVEQIVKLNKLEAAAAPAPQAETPKLTQAEAKDLMEWQDLGQKDGIKTHILTFYESKADKDAKRGRMTVATVSKEVDSKTWVLESNGEKYAMLGFAKKRAEEAGMAKAVADGFVEPAAAAPEAPKKGLAGDREVPVIDKRAPAAAGVADNFGEELPPARRTMATKLSEDLTDDKIASLPLSQIWPTAENEAIEDVGTAAAAHVMREAIPAKPRVAYKVKSWVGKVKLLRDFAAKVMRGEISHDKLVEEMQKVYALRDLAAKIKLLEQIDRAQWKRIGDVSEAPNAIRYVDGQKTPSPYVMVTVDGRSRSIPGQGNVLDHLDGIKAMLGDGAPEAKMQFEIRQEGRGERKVFINKKGDKEYRRLMEFATVDEARKAIKEQYADLVAAWDGVKDRDNITERDLRSDTNRERAGKDHRKGRDVTAEEFESKFGFRGGEFGKWVGQGKAAQERQFMLNSAYDALMDLSDLLGIPPKAISLEGSLGIAFGSRGSGWASAHFEPSNLVINLTKTRGAGALAHEWFHALDNYFARKRGGEVAFTGDQNAYRRDNFITYKTAPLMVRKDGKGTPLTKERLAEWRKSSPDSKYLSAENWMEDPNHKQGVRAEVEQAFADLVKTLNDSPMLKRARVLDGVKEAEGYWSRIIEMAARSFENFIQTRMMEQGYHNDFLANVKEAPEVGKNVERYPYLLPSEIAPVADAFKALFDTIQTKEDDAGNVAMFSRAQAPAKGIPVQTAQQIVDTIKARWKNAPEVIVLADMNDPRVPEEVRKGDAEQRSGGATGEPEGFYYKGTAYVVAGSLKTPGDVVRVLLHESLGHHGLRVVFGDGLKTILKQIATMRKSEVQAKAAEYGLDMEKESDRLQAAEEVLAVMAQNNPQAGFVKRAIGAIRAWLRENVPGLQNMRLTDNDIVTQFILPARGAVTRSKETGLQSIKRAMGAFSRGTNKAVTNPNDVVGNQGGRSADDTAPGKFAMAGDMVDGLLVRDEIPNQGSIGSSIDDYTVLRGIREIPLTAFTQLPKLKYYSISEEARTKRLAEQIKASGEINPLIVVIDKEGPYVLEGGHRFDALREIGKTSFPALVVLDNESLNEPTAPDGGGAAFSRGDNGRMTEDQAREQGFTLKAYRGVSKASPFNDTGTTWMTTSREVAEAYAEEVMGYDDPGVLEVMVKPDALPRFDASRLTDEQRAELAADDFGNPQAVGIYDRSDDHPLGGSRRNVTVIHAPREAVVVLDTNGADGVMFSRGDNGRMTDTPAFRKWFGDSKVVDADGKPLVVYHGTGADFVSFDAERIGKNYQWSKGFYFASTPQAANEYAMDMTGASPARAPIPGIFAGTPADTGSGGANIMPVYLSMQNPLIKRARGNLSPDQSADRNIEKWLSEAKAAGYDGLIVKSGNAFQDRGDVYIAFRPEQVKSAIGNNGQFDPENPDIRFSRSPRELAGMATDQINTALKSVTITSIKQAAGYKATDLMGIALGGLGRRQLVEIYGKDLPLDKYNELATQMEADKNEYGAEADTIATEWGKLKDEGALANIMHDATLAKIDPDKPLQPGDDPAAYNALKMRFSLMSKEAKETYRKARDSYKRHHANVREAIKERIERSQMSPERRAALVERMDSEFFAAMKGVYFPLARFGKYVVVVRGADGKVETVARSETMAEAAALRRNLVAGFPAAKGYQVDKVILSREFVASRDAVGRGFMQELYQVLDKQDMDPAMRAEMEDTLGQLYLSSLPDVSWAKHGIHRKGTPGFSQDARRAFAQNMFHGARYLAKLRYSDLMQTELKAMQDHVDKIGNVLPDEDGFNGPRMQRVVDEFYKRHDSLMNPNSHPLSTALTSIGFMFHLGLSPASALVNLTQTAFVAYPLMAAKWGFGKAGVALLKASKQAAMGKNDITKFLNRDERRAYDQAVKDGTIDVTQAHDLAGIAQGEDAGVMWRIRPAMRAASFLFHHAERFNRQATFVAAYRLAREAGENHETAFAQATKATYDGHYDYSAGNRPRFMQGNTAKVILLFKQYAQNMVYTLARNAYQSVNALDPKERVQARKALAGILATHAMAAGVLGLPMVTTILAAISAAGSDDDEPFDAQVALQNMLADTFGQKPAEVITRGLSRLTPWDISGRVGLDRLIFPDVQEGLEGQRLAESAAFAALGPVAGIGLNILKGIQEIGDGHMLRGITTMMPAALRGPLNAVRLSEEGAQDKTGIPIVDEVDAAAVFGQALGFSPSVVRQATEGKRAVLSYDRALNERRQELMTQYARGAMKQDAEAMQEAREAIQAFNEKNPGRRITMMQLSQSVRNRERRINQADDGVYLPKNRREAMDQGRFALTE